MESGDAQLPLVWTHQSGRKSLVLGCTARHIVGMDYRGEREIGSTGCGNSQPANRFHYAHNWTVGDMVMWDNTGTLHRAIPYDPSSIRELHRTKLDGGRADRSLNEPRKRGGEDMSRIDPLLEPFTVRGCHAAQPHHHVADDARCLAEWRARSGLLRPIMLAAPPAASARSSPNRCSSTTRARWASSALKAMEPSPTPGR